MLYAYVQAVGGKQMKNVMSLQAKAAANNFLRGMVLGLRGVGVNVEFKFLRLMFQNLSSRIQLRPFTFHTQTCTRLMISRSSPGADLCGALSRPL